MNVPYEQLSIIIHPPVVITITSQLYKSMSTKIKSCESCESNYDLLNVDIYGLLLYESICIFESSQKKFPIIQQTLNYTSQHS
jgi:hypothetical protein